MSDWENEDPLGECVEEEFITDEEEFVDEDSVDSTEGDSEELFSDTVVGYERRTVKKTMVEDVDQVSSMFSVEDVVGENFMATRPWIGAVDNSAPDNPPENDPTPPEQSLEVDWVYGYRCHDSRSNLVLNSEGKLIYPVAAIVISYDVEEHTQEYFQGHNDDVICLAQHPLDSDIVVTGQVATIVNRRGTDPHICIWNSGTGENWKIPGAHKRAVRTVCFSPDGEMVVSVGGDDKFTCKVWDWKNEELLASTATSNSKIFHAKWNPVNRNEFALVGNKVLWFMDYNDGVLSKSRGVFGSEKREVLFALCFSPKGYLLTAGTSGTVYIWVGRQIKASRKVHKGSIYALEMVEDTIISGGRDGFIKVLDKKMNIIRECHLKGGVRSINVVGDQMAVGTNQAKVYVFDD